MFVGSAAAVSVLLSGPGRGVRACRTAGAHAGQTFLPHRHEVRGGPPGPGRASLPRSQGLLAPARRVGTRRAPPLGHALDAGLAGQHTRRKQDWGSVTEEAGAWMRGHPAVCSGRWDADPPKPA